MNRRSFLTVSAASLVLAGCDKPQASPDPQLSTRGTSEVTARLVEIPEGAILKRDLYNYTAILKYEVTAVHRGPLPPGSILYIGHYNPWKPRRQAADKNVKDIGGTLRAFAPGALHRMALETPLDDHYLGGVVDPYFGKYQGPAHWAVWTNEVE